MAYLASVCRLNTSYYSHGEVWQESAIEPLEVLLVFDEIATAFGRTGKLFFLEHAQVVQDILVSVGTKGGYLTLFSTITSENLANTINQGDINALCTPRFLWQSTRLCDCVRID